MCGICGLLGSDAPDRALVEAMNAAIVHRGPDHGAVAAYGRCVLGYRRLAIVDLVTGDQPLENESGEVVAVFNGEIYNFRELRAELEAKGHEIRGTGDSPLIPHAYEEWGLDFVPRLEGMFAIALWDRPRERLVLARDRLGKKPLLYARLPDGSLAFASETKALLQLPSLPRELDLEQLDVYLALQYVPRSGLRAVEKVPPGSLAVAEGGAVRVMRYWRPEPAEERGDWVERVREEVTSAVRKRLVADVPLGALLSGGIDSSIVVAAMAAAAPEPVRTFTIGFPDRRYDEREYARAIAQRYGTRHEELEVDPEPELLDRVAEAFDEPLGDEAALPMLLICEATRRHVTVALVGDGGDEAFGGYERYRAHALAGRVPRVAAALGTAALGALPAARREPRSTLFRARRFLDAAAQPASERYARLVEVFPFELRRELWTDESRAQAARTMLPDDPDLRIVDMESYLPGDLLPKSDIASMAVSLELRAPFLDHRVIELGLALPPELARGKRALKQAFAADLPPEIAGRGKTGFGVPLDEWFRGPLRERSRELLLDRDRGLFRRPVLERLLGEHLDRRADHGHRLWCLCMLELWQRRYVDAGTPALAAA
jgi:asparagine synthase (glutamine-hydrolysing)